MENKSVIKFDDLTDEQKAWIMDYIIDERPDEVIFGECSDEQRASIESWFGGVDNEQ